MLKLKIISSILASTLVVGNINILSFISKDFTNVQNYIVKSEQAMKSANDVILVLEHKLSADVRKIKSLENTNKSLNATIASKDNTINSQAAKIKELENQLNKPKPAPIVNPFTIPDALGNEGSVLPASIQSAFDKARTNAGVSSYVVFSSLMNNYFEAQNALYWTNYWKDLAKNPPQYWMTRDINRALRLSSLYQSRLNQFISLVNTDANRINTTSFINSVNMNLPSSVKTTLNNVKISSSNEANYKNMIDGFNGTGAYLAPSYGSIAYQAGYYRALALSDIYQYDYWTYLCNNPPSNWSVPYSPAILRNNITRTRALANSYLRQAQAYENDMNNMIDRAL